MSSNKESSLELRITLNRKSKFVSTGVKLLSSEWDADAQRIKKNKANFEFMNIILQQKIIDLQNYEYELIKSKKSYTLETLKLFLKDEKPIILLLKYGQRIT